MIVLLQVTQWKMTSTFQANGRRPQLFWQMEDDLNFFGKWKMTSTFLANELEDDLNILVNGRRPQFWGKWKTTSIFWQNGRRPQFFGQMEDNLNI